jgi:glyoxylase-like metal-dependent hydrolase (beta-lactamase superfamily II)
MKILENLWQVGGAEYTSVEDAAIYLIRFGPKAALIDAGCGGAHSQLVNNISKVLPTEIELEYLFLTHCHYDHTGGAGAVRNHYGCRIVAHALDAVYLEDGDSTVTAATWYGTRMKPLKIDYQIKEKEERFPLGDGMLIAHHCPGHSPGSVIYMAELGSHLVLFGQDVHGPLDASFLSNRQDYKRSLKYLIGLDADILCEGHFGIYRGKLEVRQFIQTYLSD